MLDDTTGDSILLNDTKGSDVVDDLFFTDTVQCDEANSSAFIASEEGSFMDESSVVSHLVTPENKMKRKRNSCFNCMGDHSLAECKEEKDHRRISRNRGSFRGGKRDSTRLHEQLDNANNFTPGVISSDLRKALGIGSRDLPEWIFRMRKRGLIYGYPPAYLKRALEKNVISFVTSDINEQEDSEETIDSDKLFVYPGFNSYNRHIKDPERFKVPSFEEFVKVHQEALREKQSLKRRRSASIEKTVPSVKKRKKVVLNESIEDGEIVDDDSILNSTNDDNNITDAMSYKSAHEELAEAETVTKGTTILNSRSISTDRPNHEVQKPSLESFAKDIVPFEHRNVTEERGFFSKMLSIVKNIKKKKK